MCRQLSSHTSEALTFCGKIKSQFWQLPNVFPIEVQLVKSSAVGKHMFESDACKNWAKPGLQNKCMEGWVGELGVR